MLHGCEGSSEHTFCCARWSLEAAGEGRIGEAAWLACWLLGRGVDPMQCMAPHSGGDGVGPRPAHCAASRGRRREAP